MFLKYSTQLFFCIKIIRWPNLVNIFSFIFHFTSETLSALKIYYNFWKTKKKKNVTKLFLGMPIWLRFLKNYCDFFMVVKMLLKTRFLRKIFQNILSYAKLSLYILLQYNNISLNTTSNLIKIYFSFKFFYKT